MWKDKAKQINDSYIDTIYCDKERFSCRCSGCVDCEVRI